jgi:hypothetical protein
MRQAVFALVDHRNRQVDHLFQPPVEKCLCP